MGKLRTIRQHLTEYFEGDSQFFGSLKTRLRQRLHDDEELLVVPYRGFATAQQLYLKGRVLENRGVRPAQDDDTLWENLVATYKRLNSDPIAHARLRLTFTTLVHEVVADAEGFFEVLLPLVSVPDCPDPWCVVEVELLTSEGAPARPASATGEVLSPPTQSQFGVISDIDDTVLQTDATNLLKMARVTFLRNARTRLPFEGIAGFYRALQQGTTPETFNPIFYVSSSPWNLYDLLVDFMEVHAIPAGPLFLRDFDLSLRALVASGHHQHKLDQIDRLLTAYPTLPFVLIGDSGQEDPEIYFEAVRRYPGRIRAIYIRDVSLGERDGVIDQIIQETGLHEVEMLRVPDTAAAAQHAADNGLIDPAALVEVLRDRAQDKAAPSVLAVLVTDSTVA